MAEPHILLGLIWLFVISLIILIVHSYVVACRDYSLREGIFKKGVTVITYTVTSWKFNDMRMDRSFMLLDVLDGDVKAVDSRGNIAYYKLMFIGEDNDYLEVHSGKDFVGAYRVVSRGIFGERVLVPTEKFDFTPTNNIENQ